MTKYKCRLCEDDGIESELYDSVHECGQHINDDHEQNDINDWVCFYGNGVRRVD